MIKVCVAYDHDPADLDTIYLAVLPNDQRLTPQEDDWQPAYRDLDHLGRSIVWIKVTDPPGRVWLRDSASDRLVRPL